MEQQKVARMLSGLYKNVTEQGSDPAKSKRLERAKKRAEETEVLAEIEKEQTEEVQLDTIASAGAMFKKQESELKGM